MIWHIVKGKKKTKKGKIFNYYEEQVGRAMFILSYFQRILLILETPFKPGDQKRNCIQKDPMQNMRNSSKDLPSPNVGQIVERKIRKIECTNAEKKKNPLSVCARLKKVPNP